MEHPEICLKGIIVWIYNNEKIIFLMCRNRRRHTSI